MSTRQARVQRDTKETQITVSIDLDGSGDAHGAGEATVWFDGTGGNPSGVELTSARGMWLDDDGTAYVSANHWPRAWYNEALANPDVQVEIEGVRGDYTAVSVTDAAEHERLDTKFAHPFLFKFITGFPPRLFIRLDPQGPTA